jgi:hypothetical protein
VRDPACGLDDHGVIGRNTTPAGSRGIAGTTTGSFVAGVVQVEPPQVQFVRESLPRSRRRAYRASVDGCVPARPPWIKT